MKFFSLRDALPTRITTEEFSQFFSDPRLWSMCDQLPDGLIVVSATGLIAYMNKAAESMNEVSRRMVVGQPLRELVAQSQIAYDSLVEDVNQGLRTNREIFDADNRSYTLITRCIGAPEEESRYALIVIEDNTYRIAAMSRQAPGPGRDSISSAKSVTSGEREIPFITSPDMRSILEKSLRAMALGSRLLLLGESGVGKSRLAKYLHMVASQGDGRPFVHINCGSIPETLFESEMFGYERGSFTGASARGKKGLIEAADGGVLFLDEVGEIPLQSQAKILQVLEEGVVQRVGATSPRRLRMQVIAATNCDLQAAVLAGTFRRDLYYRLNVIPLIVPPLRERREMLALLIDHFVREVNLRRPVPLVLDADCRQRLLSYSFPGNIRELQNIVEYLSVACEEVASEDSLPAHVLRLDDALAGLDEAPSPSPDLPEFATARIDEGFDLRRALRAYEKKLIEVAIQQAGSKRAAAKLLNVDIATVVRKS